jgi:hypothetical protein
VITFFFGAVFHDAAPVADVEGWLITWWMAGEFWADCCLWAAFFCSPNFES